MPLSFPRILLFAGLLTGLRAAEPTAGQLEFFENKVRPVLVRSCYPCHSAAVASPMGGLRVDTREALLKGGKGGPAVVPGDAGQSRLLQAVRYQGAMKMPPGTKLPDEQIADLTAWVNMGLPDPRVEGAAKPRRGPIDFAAARQFWAFRPVQDPPVPTVQDKAWVRTPVDAFVLAKLQAKGWHPAPAADKRTLIRRVTFDLTGLPPDPEDVERFVQDASPQAYQRVVERLLVSPHYGERWARHWMDLVRYAETNGHEFDNDKLDPWRYRDYLIRAFNQDVPYPQLIKEHLAGDMLREPRLAHDGAVKESPLGTTFFWFGEVLNSATDSVKSRADEVDNQIDVAGKAFLGLTVACARCHDHKFDPIPTSDYYAMAGVFHSTAMREDVVDSPARTRQIQDLGRRIRAIRGPVTWHGPKVIYRPEDAPFTSMWRTTGEAFQDGFVDGLATSLAAGSDRFVGTLTSAKFHTSSKLYLHVRVAGTKSEGKLKENGPLRFTSVCDGYKGQHIMPEGSEKPRWRTLTLTLERNRDCYFEIVDRSPDGHITVETIVFSDLKEPPVVNEEGTLATAAQCDDPQCGALSSQVPPSVFAMVAADETPHDVRVHLRGNHQSLGDVAPRRFLQVIAGEQQDPIAHGSGRQELAEWFASERNPLTARVMVNRVWKHHFGQGIVRSPDNFGAMGEAPVNPELLDFLASRFVQSGWSLKAMHRLMVMSSTYQMSTQAGEAAAKGDPENKLLQHMPVRRLEGEAIRDALLAVAGTLNPEMYGPSVTPFISAYQDGRGKPASGPLDGNGRRSLYIQARRNFLLPFLLAFDYPLPISAIGARGSSTVPSQALLMMNNEFVSQQAQAWAKRALAAQAEAAGRVDWMYRQAFARPARAEEARAILQYASTRASEPAEAVWADVAHVLMNSAEFVYVP